MVTTNEAVPNTTVKTYMTRGFSATRSNVMVKFVPRVGEKGATAARKIRVDDFPGGVTACFELDGVQVSTDIAPLFVGRGTLEVEGAALYEVTTEPSIGVTVGIGGGGEQTMSVTPDIRADTLLPIEQLEMAEKTARFVGGCEKLPAGLRTNGGLERVKTQGGQALCVTFEAGSGSVLLVYADTPERVEELLDLDVETRRLEIDAYYSALFESKIDTPEDNLDRAFRSALYNLEYNWNEPYGWNECIHHWMAMWHNQHTAAAEWIGQEDRSRLCTVTHAQNLLSTGAVPQYAMDGSRRRDFGGSNHFWTWQARHYWEFTAERAFAEIVAPALDRVLAQTLEEHDADGNLLVGWGLQIGNQEDFIQFYNDGGTPSIEAINMMRTRAELAEGLRDEETARLWRTRAAKARELLIEKLWLKDLGRLGHYVDEHGKIRLDAQYHTFLYPTLWNLVDELDGYTSLRHVEDRLTGAGGEVYCSNNFPNHANGTWGMQAGAAQQPWAAWTYAKAGQHDKTVLPLLAIAREVMNRHLRGAWPEVMREHTPAYFTPPAGLYVASVIEAVFGLYVDRPAGTLYVSPSFPSDWSNASMDLPRYQAAYRREGNRLTYVVRSGDPLARLLRWSLPPSQEIEVRVNGSRAGFEVKPGVERLVVETTTKSETETEFDIEWEPMGYAVSHAGSIAEGEEIDVRLEGARIVSVDDRCGVLAGWRQTGESDLTGRVAEGLLESYLEYGRLGQVLFSRRTFFVEAEAHGIRWFVPVDIAVLPRIEAAPVGEISADAEGLLASVLIRNNREEKIAGEALLELARHDVSFPLELEARSESVFDMRLPSGAATLLSVGDNNARLTLPSGESLELTMSAAELFAREGTLRDYAESRLVNLPIPEEDKSPAEEWKALREGSHGGPVSWPGWVEPMEGLREMDRIVTPSLPGVEFEVTPGHWVLIGERIGESSWRLEVHRHGCRKFYLLLASIVDNHDMFTQLGRVTVRGEQQVIRSRNLYLPGDLDWWDTTGMAGTMNTARFERKDRLGLLPLLPPDLSDWGQGTPPDLLVHDGELMGLLNKIGPEWIPPSFPQPEYWATCRVVRTPHCNFNVVEIDLGRPMTVTSLTVDTVGICPGFAVYGIVAETDQARDRLKGTRWMPEARFREPVILFDLSCPEALEGWTLEGAALGKAVGVASLNTLVMGGERATGRALSPIFALPEDADRLLVDLHGGTNTQEGEVDDLVLRVVDAESGEVVAKVLPPSTHVISTREMTVREAAGREVRLELYDGNTGASFAWIGVRRMRLLLRD